MVFPYSKAFLRYFFISSLGAISLPLINTFSLLRNFSMRAAFSQSPNHSLNALVRTFTHCSGVRLVSLPLGALRYVPLAFAVSMIDRRSASISAISVAEIEYFCSLDRLTPFFFASAIARSMVSFNLSTISFMRCASVRAPKRLYQSRKYAKTSRSQRNKLNFCVFCCSCLCKYISNAWCVCTR